MFDIYTTSLGRTFDLLNEKAEIEKTLRRKEVEYEKMQKYAERMRFARLQSQIRPHFFFNCLNALSSLAIIEDALACRELCGKLAAFFRYTLENTEEIVSLKEELDIVQIYMDIQKCRFGDRIKLEMERGVAEDMPIPKFSIQPLVENSVVHGFARKEENASVQIKIAQGKRGRIEIRVIDNGCGFDTGLLNEVSHSVGLQNIRERLAIFDPRGKKIPFKEMLAAVWNAFAGLLTCLIIIFGVIFGWYTATESAAIAVVYAFIVTFFLYREIPLKQILPILKRSLRTIAIVLSLIATASMFGWLLAYLKVPTLITRVLLTVSDNKIVILLLINIMCLVLGCIMDMGPLILILTPILLPVCQSFGMDPVHFGSMLILNLAIGLCTPPVGAALFVGCSIGKIKIEQVTKACLPFYAAMIVTLLLVTFVPGLVMAVPNVLMK